MHRASHHRAWLPALVVFAIAALALGACGSSSATKAPSPATTSESPAASAPGASASSEPSASPEETASESVEPSSDAGSSDSITGAAAKLADIGSYRFKVTMSGKGITSAMTQSGGALTMSGTVVLKPEKALHFEIDGFSVGGSGSGGKMALTMIGDKGWIDIGTGSWMEMPAGDTSMADSFDSFRPEKLFGSTFDPFGTGFKAAGEEQKNGVDTVHFTADPDVLNRLSGMYGQGSWTADVWLAKDGGYPVSSSVAGKITSGENAGDFKISIDISNVDDAANKVTAPT